MQWCSEFFLPGNIQKTSISQAKRYIFNRTPNFICKTSLSTERLFFLAGVVVFRTTQIPRQKSTSQNIFFTEQLSVVAFECLFSFASNKGFCPECLHVQYGIIANVVFNHKLQCPLISDFLPSIYVNLFPSKII